MEKLKKTYELTSEQDTRDLAASIAPLVKPGDVICLWGGLGTGKTFFSGALMQRLGVRETVDSPSFVLMKEYHGERFPIFHLDLYRLKSEAEFLDLGITDLIETGLTLIEWPQIAVDVLPKSFLALSLHFCFEAGKRSVELVAGDRFLDYFV